MTRYTPMQHTLLILALMLAAIAPSTWAATEVFVVDTNQSTLTLSGKVAGYDIKEQAAGSLTTKIGGTILLQEAENFLIFPGGSQLILFTNGTWAPAVGGGSGSAPGNFGAKATVLFFTANAALRNTQFDVTSPALTQSNGEFDSSALVFGFLTNSHSAFDYSVPNITSGGLELSSLSTNKVATKSTLMSSGGVQTLTIPIDTTFIMKLVMDGDTTLQVKGTLVATRTATAEVKISAATVSSQGIHFQWSAPAGQKFNIVSSSDLKNWNVRESNLTSDTTSYSWSGSLSGNAEFFRISQ